MLGAALVGCAHDAERPDLPEVVELDVLGAQQIDAQDIKNKIATQQTSWLPFAKPQYFDRNVWRTDLRRIERYYRERGFYQAKVVSDDIIPEGTNQVRLVVRVQEGEPTLLSERNIEGVEALPLEQRRELLGLVELTPGDVFLEERWEALKGGLRDELLELGYVEAKVSGQATVDLATRRARIDVGIEPNQRYRFGEIRVVQAPGARVEAWRIAEQAREAIEHEAWYSESAREEAQARVFRMGVFGAARVNLGPPSPEKGTVPLVVEVQEAPFHSVRAGFGIGIEPTRHDAHLVGEYTHRDFLGGLRRLNLNALAGWAFIPSVFEAIGPGDTVNRSEPVARLTADVDHPRLFHPNFRQSNRLELEKGAEPGYGFYIIRARTGVVWQPYTYFALFPAYNFQIFRLTSGQFIAGDTPALRFGCTRDCLVSFLEQLVTLDLRDDPLAPKRGMLLALSLQEGGGPLGGDFGYLRIAPEARAYFSFLDGERLTLAVRTRLGTLIPSTGADIESAIVARFASGGNEMRGFGTRRLAPQQVVARSNGESDFEGEPVPIGGNGLFEGSLEARYRFTEKFVGATFVDTGFVTIERLQPDFDYFRQNLMVAVGVGLRYLTPVGPVRLDLAYRLPSPGRPLPLIPSPDGPLSFDRATGCFGIGEGNPDAAGAPESPCALHLSIGEAF